MGETFVFSFRWFWAAIRTMPDFLGNNWVGAAFACVVGFIIERKQFYATTSFSQAVTWPDKRRLLGDFLVSRWRETLRFWLFIFMGFLLGHMLDLIRHDSERLKSNNESLTTYAIGEPARQQNAVDAGNQMLSIKLSDLQLSCGELKGANGALERQNRDQNTLISGCQEDAIKRMAPEPQKLVVLTIDDVANAEDRETSYLLITNKEVTPVRIRGYCDVHLDSVAADPVGISTHSAVAQIDNPGTPPLRYGQTQTPSTFSIGMTTPAWTPASPLRFKAKYHALKTANCFFSVR